MIVSVNVVVAIVIDIVIVIDTVVVIIVVVIVVVIVIVTVMVNNQFETYRHAAKIASPKARATHDQAYSIIIMNHMKSHAYS